MWCFTVFAALGSITSVNSNFTLGDLVYVVVVTAVHEVTPMGFYPKDPHARLELWNYSTGQLTNKGKRDAYSLGRWLRKRYDKFLPPNYSYEDVYIQASDSDRAIMAASCIAAGLYQVGIKDVFPSSLAWQPVPIHTAPESDDQILGVKESCPRYLELLQEAQEEERYEEFHEKFEDVLTYATIHTGRNYKSYFGLAKLYDTLLSEYKSDLELPEWTKNIFPEPLREITGYILGVPCSTNDLIRLRLGPFFGEVLFYLELKKLDLMVPDRKLWLFNGHTYNMVDILQTLNAYNHRVPEPSGALFFELRKYHDDHFVNIYHLSDLGRPLKMINVNGCELVCPYLIFHKSLAMNVPEDWQNECAANGFVYHYPVLSLLFSTFILTYFIIIFLN